MERRSSEVAPACGPLANVRWPMSPRRALLAAATCALLAGCGGTSRLVVTAPAVGVQATTPQAGQRLGFPTVAAKAGDTVEIFGVGFGPTNPAVLAGAVFTGAAPTTNSVTLSINNASVTPSFAGETSAGLYQINVTIPPGLGAGDVSLRATVGGAQTPTVVISLQ